MAYIGKSIESGTFSVLDTSGNTYNGSNVTFNLGTQVGSPAQLLVSHDGVIQKPGTDYTLATGGTQITFTTAPASGASIFIVEISGAVGGPLDSDLNGTELILDADGDTSITADTDDQIDFKIAGADDLKMTANAINVLSGTTLTIDSGATITNSGTANGFGALAGIDDQSSSNDDQITITDTAVVINEDSDDLDFRVESNTNANMLFVSGGNNIVGIGNEGDLGTGLHIKAADTGASANSSADELVIEGTSTVGLSFLTNNDQDSNITFGDSDNNERGRIIYSHSNDHMIFNNAGSERMRFITAGNLTYAKTSDNFATAGITLYGESGSEGHLQATMAGGAPLALNRLTNDGTLLDFYQAGGYEGNVSVSGSTVSYNTFCGSHWTRLADNSKPTILRGTVMESIATMCDWYQAVAQVAESTDSDGNVISAHDVKESITLPDGKSVGDAVTFTSQGREYTGVYVKEDNEQLPKCKISDTADSKAVYGVFMTWDDADDGLDGDVNDMNIASLGAFVVRVHKDETVAIGNWLVSKGDGTAKVLAGNTAITADVQSSLIGKVTSTTKTHIHADGSYCVPCTLHCG